MPTLDKQLDTQRKRAELARLKVETNEAKAQLRRQKAIDKVVQKYDALDQNYDTQRAQPSKERKSEDKLQTHTQRLKGAALGRDLQRNCAPFKTLQHQFKVSVVGAIGPKVQFNTGDNDWNAAASMWFNSDWAKWCDGSDDTPLAEQVAMALQAVKREGDILCVFDDFDRDDGTVRWFESDQLVTVDERDWNAAALRKDFVWKERKPGEAAETPMEQCNGVVTDYRGRVMAYVVSNQYGLSSAPLDEVTIIPRWDIRQNPTGSARLIKAPWRLTQKRGAGDALTIANQQKDIYEMVSAELQSAKNTAQRAGWVEVDKDSEGGIERALMASGMSLEDIDTLLYGEGEKRGTLGKQYEALEGAFGGRVDYLNPGEKFVAHDHNRPESSVSDFGGYIQQNSGASMGVARSRSTLKAETSYTAFRGEELMSWQTFEWDQKFLERRLMDFLAYKAITWAIVKRELDNTDDKWIMTAQWVWPKMREVDEARTASAQKARLKDGTRNYRDILGPNWKAHFEQLSEEIAAAQQLELPLAIFETVAGAPASDNNQNDEGQQDE